MNTNIFSQFPVLETERLFLGRIEPVHLKDFYEIFSSENVMVLYGMYALTEYKDAAWFIQRFNESFAARRSIRWGMYLKSNGKLIGTCGYHGFSEMSSRAEMGYELNEVFWRQGYMDEALKAIITWGFSVFDLNRIEVLIYPENQASEGIALKNHFKFEGLLRQYAYFRDIYQDLNMFSLLRQEWSDV